LTIRVIQVSERDTQKITSYSPKEDEYISTWNIPSFCEELAAPSEFSWGTHETEAPPGTKFSGEMPGEKSFVSLSKRGHQTFAKSWMPIENEFRGLVVRHEECFSMANFVTVRDEVTGELVYRPSVYFVYDQALSTESIAKFVKNNYELLPHNSVLEREIDSGADKLGVLLLGHDFGAWWVGSHLDITQARELCAPMEDLVGSVGATALQVGCSLASAVYWGILNPFMGAHFPESLPTDFVVEFTKPWLGTWVSQRYDWSPSPCRSPKLNHSQTEDDEPDDEEEEEEKNDDSSDSDVLSTPTQKDKSERQATSLVSASALDFDDVWQFSNFLVGAQ